MSSLNAADQHDYATDVVPMEHRRWHRTSIGYFLIGCCQSHAIHGFGGLTTILSMIIGTIITIGGAGFLFALLGSR